MAESTVMEALTAELLGDVGLLHKQIKALPDLINESTNDLIEKHQALTQQTEEQVQASTNDAVTKLQIQIENILSAAQQLGQGLNEFTKQADKHINKASNQAVENAIFAINKGSNEAVTNAIKSIFAPGITNLYGGVAQRIVALDTAVNAYKNAFDDERYAMERNRKSIVIWCGLVTFVSTLAAGGILLFLSKAH